MPPYVSALTNTVKPIAVGGKAITSGSGGGAPALAPAATGTYQPPAGGGLSNILSSILKTPGAPVQQVPNFDDPASWPKWLTDAMNAANQANLNQRNQVLSLLQGGGQSAKQDAQQQFDNSMGSMNQDMISRGLNNTTMPMTAKMGLTRELNRQNERIDENTADRAAGVLERMDNNGPDLGLFANLFSEAMKRPLYAGLGNALGYGGGGGGGGFSSSPVANRSASATLIGPGGPRGLIQTSNGLDWLKYQQDALNFLNTGQRSHLSGLFAGM